MEKATPKTGTTFAKVENHSAPEFFVSHVAKANLEAGGIAKLTFFSDHASLGDAPHVDQVVNLRLAMSLTTAADLHRFLGEWLQRIQLAAAPVPEGGSGKKH